MRMVLLNRSMQAARGEMAEVIDGFFAEWGLTPSERDVALMVLKGIDNEAIAEMRGTATGTVRAQCTSIYSKAGVDGRAQLFSVFMEELLAGGETA
jgi:DNA-binding CsgD family transcriptional regulator